MNVNGPAVQSIGLHLELDFEVTHSSVKFDAMEPVRHQYLFDDLLVYEEAFALDILKAAERLGFDVSALPIKDAAPDL